MPKPDPNKTPKMHLIWQLGPLKGQPKLCKVCFAPAVANHNNLRLCRRCLLAKTNPMTFKAKRNSRARLARALRAFQPDTVRHDPSLLSTCNVRNQTVAGRNRDSYFDHLPPAQREIAERELLRQLRACPNYTPRQIGAMVARAIAYSKFGGKRGFDAHGRRMAAAKRYWRYMLAYHPDQLPAGLDLSSIPQQPVPDRPSTVGRARYNPHKDRPARSHD